LPRAVVVPDTMEGLDVTDCERCPALCESRSRIVNGVGPADAELVLVGEAPGAREDEAGEPFVGRSGRVLDEALQDRGLARADVRITNCVRCRPPENRDPRAGELEDCREYLETEIDRLDPAVVVALGKVPSEHLLGREVAVSEAAGRTVEARVGGSRRRVVVSVHPAATLYDGSRREAFDRALDEAVALAGVGDEGGQSRLGEF